MDDLIKMLDALGFVYHTVHGGVKDAGEYYKYLCKQYGKQNAQKTFNEIRRHISYHVKTMCIKPETYNQRANVTEMYGDEKKTALVAKKPKLKHRTQK